MPELSQPKLRGSFTEHDLDAEPYRPDEACHDNCDRGLERKTLSLFDTLAPTPQMLKVGAHNLAEYLHEPEDKTFKEVMLLKKIDQERIVIQKTVNGKFKDPEFRASYCAQNWQLAYLESKTQSNAEAEQKAVEEKLRLDPWRPREGVYATSGINFNDHCLKNGDATVELTERSISIGSDRCSVTFIRDEPDDAIKLFATCIGAANANGSVSPGPDTIILARVDDKTLFIQKSRNGKLAGSGEQLSYCSEDVQKMHAQQKAAK
jgi:hypothetical protein